MARTYHPERAEQILHTLARMLEDVDAGPVRTAALASAVGVSEAALYRHFPSKGRMFRALIEFIEQSLVGHCNRILAEHQDPGVRCGKIMNLYLGFAEHNPGLCRVITGDALCGEDSELRRRARKLHATIETLLKQVFREALYIHRPLPVEESARLLTTTAMGRIHQYVASGYRDLPTDGWARHWEILAATLFSDLDTARYTPGAG